MEPILDQIRRFPHSTGPRDRVLWIKGSTLKELFQARIDNLKKIAENPSPVTSIDHTYSAEGTIAIRMADVRDVIKAHEVIAEHLDADQIYPFSFGEIYDMIVLGATPR